MTFPVQFTSKMLVQVEFVWIMLLYVVFMTCWNGTKEFQWEQQQKSGACVNFLERLWNVFSGNIEQVTSLNSSPALSYNLVLYSFPQVCQQMYIFPIILLSGGRKSQSQNKIVSRCEVY